MSANSIRHCKNFISSDCKKKLRNKLKINKIPPIIINLAEDSDSDKKFLLDFKSNNFNDNSWECNHNSQTVRYIHV